MKGKNIVKYIVVATVVTTTVSLILVTFGLHYPNAFKLTMQCLGAYVIADKCYKFVEYICSNEKKKGDIKS